MVLCAAHVRMEKNFDRWNEIKKATDAADEAARLYFREGEIWWVRLGHNIGYEANGKSREFTRPAIILKKYNQYSFLALPLTTVPKPNPYRYPVGIVDGKRAFATLSQLRNIDSKRLVKKIMHLDADIFIAIKKEASRVNFG
jgi:mRNA interferase MazF